jgi:hypothetical protein
LQRLWNKVDSAEKQKFIETVRELFSSEHGFKHCIEKWHGGFGSRKIIEIRSGITNIDFLFEMAEIVNVPIHEFFNDEVENLFPHNNSVKVVRGPIKRPSRAIEYDVQTVFRCFLRYSRRYHNLISYRKVYRVYRGDVSKLTDVVRCQIVFPDLSKVAAFMNRLQVLHKTLNIQVLRIRNRLDDNYDAATLTLGYRDCNIKIRIPFELDNSTGSVIFKKFPYDHAENVVKQSFFWLTGVIQKSLTASEYISFRRRAKTLYFICELQLILQVRYT